MCFLYNLAALPIPHAVQSVAGAWVALSLGTTGRGAASGAPGRETLRRPIPGQTIAWNLSEAGSAHRLFHSSVRLSVRGGLKKAFEH